MKHVWIIVTLFAAGCAAGGGGTTTPATDPTFKSLTDAQAYYDRLEQQQRKMLANFPSIKRAPCPPEPGLVPGTP